MDNQEKESMFQKLKNTVYLAALLHDIGKFYQRAQDEKEGTHSFFTRKFFNEILNDHEKHIEKLGVDYKLATLLASHHHENPKHKEDGVSEVEGTEHKKLAYIISRADNYSSSERADDDEKTNNRYGDFKVTPLNSIFERIKVKDSEDKKTKKSSFYYPAYFYPTNIFPEINYDKNKFKESLKNLWKAFEDEIRNLKVDKFNNFSEFFTKLESILEKYTWAIPSSTQENFNDISLFDHLKTTAAIAGVLLDYHYKNREISKVTQEAIKDDNEKKFILLGGDISGIQSWIFNFPQNEAGASKLLRARSFYLSMLEKAVAYYIVKSFQLETANILYSNGGRFSILLPNSMEAKEKLKKIVKEIDTWIFNFFEGDIAVVISDPISFSGADFGTLKSENDEEDKKSFEHVYKKVGLSLGLKKKKKFSSQLQSDGKWETDSFIYDIYAQKKGGDKLCSTCKSFFTKEGEDDCKLCFHLKKLGGMLPKLKGIRWSYTRVGEKKFPLLLIKESRKELGFFAGKVRIELLDGEENLKAGDLRIYQGQREVDGVKKNFKYDLFISNYIPSFISRGLRSISKFDVCVDCARKNSCDLENQPSHILTFQCIAQVGSLRHKKFSETKLAVFKADVDDLGTLFKEGLGNNFSISRFLTLSRMLDAFFAGYVYYLLDKEYPTIYTVFSGGDDLLLVGHWEDILSFAVDFRKNFTRFVSKRSDIHFSAGFEIINPSYPLRFAVEKAEEALEESKAQGKDRITLFDTTVSWKEFPELLELGKEFKGELLRPYLVSEEREDLKLKAPSVEEQILSPSYFYKMLYFQNKFTSQVPKERSLAQAQFFYSVGRNLSLNNLQNNDKKEVIENLREKLLKDLFGDNFNEEIAYKAKLPVYYAIYGSRREEGKKEPRKEIKNNV